ncbi:MAG TPA: type II CAAX endopeptidase family protein [Desulfatiglandales bacterium]|nr:type II CAAX endopeptidase family protein [Desulfatiglandales bacterium]
MEARSIEIKAFLLSLGAIILIEGAARLLISRGLYNPMIVLGGTRVLETGIIVSSVLLWGKGLPSIGLARAKITPGIRRGLIWSAGFALVAAFASVVLYVVGLDPLKLIAVRLPGRLSEILIFFLIGGIVGPIAEEMFFRGMLYGFLRRWGIVVAIVVSTGVFVLAHPISQGFPIPQAVGGIVFALAYEIEGSLMTPIVVHVLGNLALFTLSLIA